MKAANDNRLGLSIHTQRKVRALFRDVKWAAMMADADARLKRIEMLCAWMARV